MGKLDITKGEWRKVGHGVYSDSLFIAALQYFDVSSKEVGDNGKLIADAGNAYQQCKLLPSELLEQNKELREAFNEAMRIQKENYGNGMNTHLKLSTWANKHKALKP